MNALEFAKKHDVPIEEIEMFLENHNFLLLSRTHPLSKEIMELLNDGFVSGNSSEDMPETGENLSIPQNFSDGEFTSMPVITELYEAIFGKELQNYIEKGYHIIIDTCVFLLPSFKSFYAECRPLLKPGKIMLEIPFAVYAELSKKKGPQKENADVRERAEYAVQLILQDVNAKFIRILGDGSRKHPDKNGEKVYFADPDIYEQIIQWRNDGDNVLFITEDGDLAENVYNLQDLPGMKSSSDICVKTLNQNGKLTDLLRLSVRKKNNNNIKNN